MKTLDDIEQFLLEGGEYHFSEVRTGFNCMLMYEHYKNTIYKIERDDKKIISRHKSFGDATFQVFQLTGFFEKEK